MRTSLIIITFIIFYVISCNQNEPSPGNDPDGTGNSGGGTGNKISDGWLIPSDQIFDGGPGKDGIPALDNPEMISATEVGYLNDNDLVIGFKDGGEVKAYSHNVLDWHEIINDRVGDKSIAITYCPLTGTGIGWNREIDGEITTFGVSGLLYNANLIPFDRKTDSNWSQIKLECVNGELIGTEAQTYQVVETTWKTWKELYPQTTMVSTNTGHNRNYQFYPYGDYKTNNNNILFPFHPKDDRLPIKERVHGVIIEEEAKIYQFKSFSEGLKIINDSFKGKQLVIIGSKEKNLIVSFVIEDDEISFDVLNNAGEAIFEDNHNNQYNVFGEVVKGPDMGKRLKPSQSFIGYWFSWGAFYPSPIIY